MQRTFRSWPSAGRARQSSQTSRRCFCTPMSAESVNKLGAGAFSGESLDGAAFLISETSNESLFGLIVHYDIKLRIFRSRGSCQSFSRLSSRCNFSLIEGSSRERTTLFAVSRSICLDLSRKSMSSASLDSRIETAFFAN
jgi:hypothetical protein